MEAVMNYKFELWRYGFFDYEEAERHLNQMGKKGWNIRGVTSLWFPMAVYEKNEENRSKRYSMVPIKEDDSDFVRICEDAGWRKVNAIRGGLCIFEDTEGAAKPPFTDEMTKYQNMLEVAEANNPIGSAVVLLILIAVTFFQNFKDGWGSIGYYVVAGIFLMAVLSVLIGLKEYHFHKKAAEFAEEGIILEKSDIYRKFESFSLLCGAIVTLGLILCLLYCDICIYHSILAFVITVTAPALYLFGSYMQAATRFEVTGILLMFISFLSPTFTLILIEGI